MEKTGEPGSARFGNFINYYDFNPAERRISFLPSALSSSLFQQEKDKIVILDIGCNSGVTCDQCLTLKTD